MPARRGALAPCLLALCLALPAKAELQPVGTEYWFAWPETADVTGDDPDYDLDGELLILTDAPGPVSVTVTAPGLSWSGAVSAGTPARVRVPRALMMEGDGVVEAKGIRVHSEDCGAFSALFRVPGSGASVGDDVMTLLPITNLGTLYYPDTYHGLAEFVVAAVENDTTVSWDNPHCPGPTTLVLDRGEAVQHECPILSLEERGIHGTRVESDKPVAVFGASAASNIVNYFFEIPNPVNFIWCCADILMEQMRPVNDWEFEYRTVPGVAQDPGWAGDFVRILAGCDDTEVRVDDGTDVRVRQLDAGDTWDLMEIDIFGPSFNLSREPLTIQADQPVQVSQYTPAFQNAGMGDPSQLLVPGLGRPAGTYPFLILDGYQSYVNVVAPTGAASQVFLDGTPVAPGAWTLYPDGAYVWARLAGLPPGQHALTSPVPLAVSILGYSLDDDPPLTAGAIAYPAPSGGTDDPFPSLITAEPICEHHCPGDCIRLDAGAGYVSWEWSTGETSREIVVCPTHSETYTVTVLDQTGCEGLGRIHIPLLEAPDPVITGELVVCEGDCTDLSVGPGYASILWSTGETDPDITYCPGRPLSDVSVTVTDANGCTGQASVTVESLYFPDFVSARAADADPCTLGILVEWDPADWHSDPPDGTYAVYRSQAGCAQALAGPPLAEGLTATSWLDAGTQPGAAYYYVVEAEDAGTGAPCVPDGGLATSLCIEPPVPEVFDRTPPAPGAGKSLRGAEHQAAVVALSWDGAPALDPAQGEHFHLYRSDDVLGPFLPITPEAFTDRRFTDASAAGNRLLFYDLRMADRCENVGLDPYPPTPQAPPACFAPVLAEGQPLAWDTLDPPCPAVLDTHACTPLDMTGGERAHRLETAAPGPFTARLLDADPRLDLLLYDGTLSNCLAWGDEEIFVPDLAAGPYLLVVDGPAGSEGAYSLVFESRR